jgi:D-sedoheptulose 7-phosphate isomerase
MGTGSVSTARTVRSPDKTREPALADVQADLQRVVSVLAQMADGTLAEVVAAANLVSEAIRVGGKVVCFGNGGSAATAQHLVAELVGRFLREREGMPAVALAADGAVVTALSNDYGFDAVFARQVKALCGDADVLVGFTTSAASSNVTNAFDAGRTSGCASVAFTGRNSRKLGELVDVCVSIPSDMVPRIQEGHLVAGHLMCKLVELNMSSDASRTPAPRALGLTR